MKIIIIGFVLFLILSEGLAQQTLSKADHKATFAGVEEIQRQYLDSLYLYSTGAWKDVINGRDYIRYFFLSEDNPLIRFNEERSATVIFKGREYSDLVLHYDTFTDEVVYSDNNLILNNKICEVALNSDNISRFDLFFKHDTLTFRFFRKEQDSAFNLKEGYYEVVYDGECKYIIKHVSKLYLSDGVEKYPYSPEGYVRVGNRFVQKGSRKQFLKLFGDRAEDIRHFMHKEKIRLRRADKHQVTDILKFYESLQTQAG